MNTISNERLGAFILGSQPWNEEIEQMATELLALRKERERAEPVGYRKLFTCSSCGAEGLDEPLESRCHCNGDGARWIEGRLYTALPAPGADDDPLPYDPQIADYEQMMEAEQAQADTTSQQFESLSFKSVVPEGWKLVPMRLTAENGAKGALSGEFSETKFVNCHECFGDDECETCDGSGRIEITLPVTWTTIKEIWTKGVEHFAAFPQSPGNEPSTVSGKWIPCSERMPDEGGRYWCYVEEINSLGKSHYQWNCSWNGEDWGGEGFYGRVTHWQPLPEPPCK